MNTFLSSRRVTFFWVVAVLVFAYAVSAQTYTEPSSSPPGGNAAAPLNVSVTDQTKAGGLIYAAGVVRGGLSVNTKGAIDSLGLLVPEGNVGIGKNALSPTAKLDVDGQIRIRGGSPGAGKVLTSGADGLATWTAQSAGVWATSGNNIYNTNTGYVGTKTNLIVGDGGNAELITRHINGKQVGSNGYDRLFLQWHNGATGVDIGKADGVDHNLRVFGRVEAFGQTNTEGGQFTLMDGDNTGGWEIDNQGGSGGEILRFFRDKGVNNTPQTIDFRNDATIKAAGFCMGGGCKTDWSQVGGASYWQDRGNNNISNSNSGSVGIGTQNPSEKLDVAGNVKAAGFCIGSDCRGVWPSGVGGGGTINQVAKFTSSGVVGNSLMTDNGGSVGIGTGADRLNLELLGTFHRMAFNELRFYDWTTDGDMVTFNNGSVGIGVTNPATKLHVSGGDVLFQSANIYMRDSGSGNAVVLRDDGGSTLHLLPWGGNHWSAVGIGLGTPANLYVNGRVGIANTGPNYSLEIGPAGSTGNDLAVHGDIRLWGALKDTFGGGDAYYLDLDTGGNLKGNLTINDGNLTVQNNGCAVQANLIISSGDQNALIQSDRKGCDGGTDLVFKSRDGGGSLQERMRFTESGDVVLNGKLQSLDLANWADQSTGSDMKGWVRVGNLKIAWIKERATDGADRGHTVQFPSAFNGVVSLQCTAHGGGKVDTSCVVQGYTNSSVWYNTPTTYDHVEILIVGF